MELHLTINLGGLANGLKLSKKGEIEEDEDEEEIEDPMDMTLDGLLAGAKEKYKIEVI
jgi:hypothetical protein